MRKSGTLARTTETLKQTTNPREDWLKSKCRLIPKTNTLKRQITLKSAVFVATTKSLLFCGGNRDTARQQAVSLSPDHLETNIEIKYRETAFLFSNFMFEFGFARLQIVSCRAGPGICCEEALKHPSIA